MTNEQSQVKIKEANMDQNNDNGTKGKVNLGFHNEENEQNSGSRRNSVNNNQSIPSSPVLEMVKPVPQPPIDNEAQKDPPAPDDYIGKIKKKGYRKFLQEVKDDLMNKDLLPLKILFFFKYATLFVLYPFLTLHLKSLGLDAKEAGINSALIPIVALIGPPFSGMIADKIGNFKVFLSGITLLNAPFALALLLVPIARETITLPELVTFKLSCDPSSSPTPQFMLELIDSSKCDLNQKWSSLSELPNGIIQCGIICSLNENSNLLPYNAQSNYSSSAALPDDKSMFRPSNYPKIFCPGPGDDNNCNSDSSSIFHTKTITLISGDSEQNFTYPKFGIGIFRIGGHEFDFSEQPPNCPLQNEEINESEPLASSCSNECLVQYNRTLFCSNTVEEKVYNVGLTFGLYTLIRILLGVASATSFIMFEGAVIAILKEYGGDYGLQRVSATFAAILAAPLSGLLIQAFHNFYPAFYLYGILQVISAIITLKIDLRFKKPAEKILGHLHEVLSQIEILIFFAAMLLSGTAWGYLESFLFWFLEDLKATRFLMGLTISVGGLAGIPLLILSRPIIKQFGHVNVLCLGLVFYSARLIGYSFIQNPWLCLPFEAMEAITSSLAITAAATYAASMSSHETIATIQGIWGGLYFGFGRGAGSLLGGFFHEWYGARNTFRIFSCIALAGGILYFLLNIFCIEKIIKHQRKTSGLNLHDRKGNRAKRLEELEKQKQNNKVIKNNLKGSPPQYELNEFHNGDYIGPCDINKFTDVPLDEDVITPQAQVKTDKNKSKLKNVNNAKN